MIVLLVCGHNFIENGECLNLEEDPSLLGLVDDSLEERGGCLDQEWVFFWLILVFKHVEILINDVIVDKGWKFREKVELSLDDELFFRFFIHLFIIEIDILGKFL